MMPHEPAEILAGERAIGDDAGVVGPIRNLPGLAYDGSGWKLLLVECLQLAPTPDAFLENRIKSERIKRHVDSGTAIERHNNSDKVTPRRVASPRNVRGRGNAHSAF